MNDLIHIKIEPDLVIIDNNDERHQPTTYSSTVGCADNENNNECDIKSNCCKNTRNKFGKSADDNLLNNIKCEPKLVINDEKPTCDECGTTFKYKSQIIRHFIQVHTLVKPFKCDICQETFVDKYYIRNHMQRHSGIKPYHCKICKKKFCHAFNIKKHMLVHTGLRPYKCTKCDRTYKHSSHLKRHLDHHEDGKDHWDTRPEGFVPEKKKRQVRNKRVKVEKNVVERRGKSSKNVAMIDVIKELTDIFS